MDKDVQIPEHLADLQAQLEGMELVPLLRLFMEKFDLSPNQLGIAAEIDVSALYKIFRGEHREFKSDYVDSLLDDLETTRKLTDPLEKEIWRRALRIAAYVHYEVYIAAQKRLDGIEDENQKRRILSEYVKSLYPALSQTYSKTHGKFPALVPIEIVVADRLMRTHSTIKSKSSESFEKNQQLSTERKPSVGSYRREPITKEGLLMVLGKQELTAAIIVEEIERSGVTFELTTLDELGIRRTASSYLKPSELDKIISAIRSNYRSNSQPN